MTTTKTATAMTSPARNMPSGTVSRSVVYDNTTSVVNPTASANALRIQFCRIPNQAEIMFLQERHSTGAATCAADIGIKDQVLTLSAFMSQVSQGTANFAQKLPYVVSITDTQATQYAYIVGGYTVGTASGTGRFKLNVIYTMSQD